MESLADGPRYGRREGIAYLPVSGGFAPGELPIVRKALQARHHGDGKPWHSFKITLGGGIGNAQTVNA